MVATGFTSNDSGSDCGGGGAGPFTGGHIGSRWYRAPELLLNGTSYSFAVDIWSVGVLFASLLRCALPLSSPMRIKGQPMEPFLGSYSQNQTIEHSELYDIRLDQLDSILLILGNPQSSDIDNLSSVSRHRLTSKSYAGVPWCVTYKDLQDDEAIDLLQSMLQWNPTSRISASEAINHPYFSHVVNQSIHHPAPADSSHIVIQKYKIMEQLWKK